MRTTRSFAQNAENFCEAQVFFFTPNVDEEDSTIRINIISVSSYFYP